MRQQFKVPDPGRGDKKTKIMDEHIVKKIGWVASAMAVLMFCAYLDQVRLNLSGRPGSVLLPAATCINCLAWVAYAFFLKKRDWPIFACNSFGAVVAAITTLTAL